jgi:hypothetical protein
LAYNTEQGEHLFDQLNARGQVHAKIDEDPHDALALIFFLLKYEHMMVEELLQLFVDKVDPQLFERVELR